MLSRKHYISIASIIDVNTTQDVYGDEFIHRDDLINDLCKVFARDNKLFDSSRFRRACDGV